MSAFFQFVFIPVKGFELLFTFFIFLLLFSMALNHMILSVMNFLKRFGNALFSVEPLLLNLLCILL